VNMGKLRIGVDGTQASEYDPLSIMLYQIDPAEYDPNVNPDQIPAITPDLNTQLSEGDKAAIRQLYPPDNVSGLADSKPVDPMVIEVFQTIRTRIVSGLIYDGTGGIPSILKSSSRWKQVVL